MTTFLRILFCGILMSVIALVGSATLVLQGATPKKLLLSLIVLDGDVPTFLDLESTPFSILGIAGLAVVNRASKYPLELAKQRAV
jgi:hypothetical protein